MFGLLLLLFLTNVSHVQPNYRNRGYSKRLGVNPYNAYNPSNFYYGWNKKPARWMNVYGYAKEPQSDWFHDMGDDWEVSNKLTSVNPYFNWYKKAAKQIDLYGPAKHVGNINRGQFLNPELNTPADRAFGHQSDFNPSDLNSGAFKYKPKGQKFRAKAVHVNEGLASYVGEVRTMPIGQYVQEDGTILVQTDYKKVDPCNPNPCTNVRMSACTIVNKFTAKCSRSKTYKLILTWDSVDPDETEDNDISLLLVPARHDGTVCEIPSGEAYLYHSNDDECGVLFSEDDYSDDRNSAEEYATLTTLADGTKYQDYTYAVIAGKVSPYNLSEGGPTLTVKYDGVVKQTLAIPQYSLGGANVNWDYVVGRDFYFFGCFRPQYGFVDTRGAGYYYHIGDNVIGDKAFYDAGLCKELLDWTDAAGFNPHDQSGSGSGSGEVYSWRDLN